MAFEYRTIWQPDTNLPFEYQTGLVFRWLCLFMNDLQWKLCTWSFMCFNNSSGTSRGLCFWIAWSTGFTFMRGWLASLKACWKFSRPDFSDSASVMARPCVNKHFICKQSIDIYANPWIRHLPVLGWGVFYLKNCA